MVPVLLLSSLSSSPAPTARTKRRDGEVTSESAEGSARLWLCDASTDCGDDGDTPDAADADVALDDDDDVDGNDGE